MSDQSDLQRRADEQQRRSDEERREREKVEQVSRTNDMLMHNAIQQTINIINS